MSNLDREALNTGLDAMARQIESALDYDVEQRRMEGLETTPDTHLISPPSWPSHGCLRHWIKALDQARKLLSAAPAVTVTEGWQPIETAPKDGTRVLLARSGWRPDIGYWEPDWYGSTAWVNGFVTITPTHWQPLPTPPSTTPQTGSQE